MKAREVALVGALVASLAWNVVQPGDPVPTLETVGEFAAAVNSPGEFNRMVTYGRQIPDSWHKRFVHENFPDTMIVAMWPERELVCLIPRPVYEIRVYTDPADSTRFDYWHSASMTMQPDVGDTLHWEMEFAPRDSVMWEGDWIKGDGCFQILATPVVDTY